MKINTHIWSLLISGSLCFFSLLSLAQPTLQWDKTIGGAGHDYPLSIIPTPDGGYLVGGYSASNASGDKSEDIKGSFDYWVVKIDGSGNKIWDKTIGGNHSDVLRSIIPTPDGGYLLAGSSASDASGDKSEDNKRSSYTAISDDYWVVKIDADGNKIWDKTIGGNNYDELTSIISTPDGGYLLAGSSGSDASGDKSESSIDGADYWVVKIDADGNKIWDETIGGTRGKYDYSDNDHLSSIIPTHDGGYLLGGWSASYASGDKSEASKGEDDYWIVKIDGSGNKIWDKTIGGSAGEILKSTIPTPDGGYLLAGYSGSNISGDKTEDSKGGADYWVVKIDGSGNKVWDKTIGGSRTDALTSIISTPDGGYLLAGYSRSDISGDKSENSRGSDDYWVVKIDADGNKIWDKTIGGISYDNLQSTTLTPDGDYLLAGWSSSRASGDKSRDSRGGSADYWVVKLLEAPSCSDPAPSFTTSNLCFNEAVQFTDASTQVAEDATYTWDFGDGTTSNTKGNVTHTYTSAGTYTVKLTITQGSCEGSYSTEIVVNALPTATLSGDATICAGSSTNLSVALTGTGPWSVTYTDGTTPVTVAATSSPLVIPVSPASSTTYAITAVSDANCTGTLLSGSATVTVNTAPVLTVPAIASVTNEPGLCGATVNFAATATGTPSPDITYTIGDDATPVTISSPYLFPVGTTTVKAIATNDCGTDEKTFTVTVTNDIPVIAGTLTAPVDPNPVGTTVTVSDIVTDNNIASVEWYWNDGIVTTGAFTYDAATGTNSVTGVRTFDLPYVYTVTLKVTDHCGESEEYAYPDLMVIYDPDGGFVTGRGLMNSPAGAYTADPTLTGQVTFAFVSKYKPGTNILIGNTNFKFKAGNVNFKSTSYEWLVVAGHSAKFKGEGMINDGGNYGFMLSAVDGSLIGDGVTDKFRIKIWDKTSGTVIYDNEVASDDAEASTAIAGGNIIIQKAKSDKTARYDDATAAGKAMGEENLEIPAAFKLNVYPNPVQKELSVELESETEEEITISVYDLLGRRVYERKQIVVKGNNQILLDVASWKITTDQMLFRLHTPSKGLHQLLLLKPE